jgi:hypothetical protein
MFYQYVDLTPLVLYGVLHFLIYFFKEGLKKGVSEAWEWLLKDGGKKPYRRNRKVR